MRTLVHIYPTHTKFDNNPFGSFGDYVSNKIGYRHRTDTQTHRQTDGNGRLLEKICIMWQCRTGISKVDCVCKDIRGVSLKN